LSGKSLGVFPFLGPIIFADRVTLIALEHKYINMNMKICRVSAKQNLVKI